MWPREHGAYGQLGAPLLGALLLHTPTVGALSLAAAACCAFLANEPLLVVLGQRGERMRASYGPVAARRLMLALLGAVVSGGFGLARGSQATLEIAGLAAIPAACLATLAWSRRQHTFGGELVAAIAFPGAAAPVLVADGVSVGNAVMIWAAWAVGYACCVVAVHRVLAHRRRPRAQIDRVLALGFASIVVTAVVLHAALPVASIAIPLVVVALYLVVRPPPAKRMRAIGVALVIASCGSLAFLIALR
ncbi:MAG: YwiC-like family protein [Deltaproteobacteria bacterium]